MYPGDHFGEIALLYKARRSSSVVSTNFTTLAKMTAEDFENLLSKFPSLKELFLERVEEYDENLKLFFERALLSIDFLNDIP